MTAPTPTAACKLCGNPPGQKVGPPALVRCVNKECEGSKLGAETLPEWNIRNAAAVSQPEVLTKEALRLLHNSTCFGKEVCTSLPCPCAESLATLGAAQASRTPAFEGMIANLIELDKQRTPGPWRKSHEAIGAPGNVNGNPQHLPLVAECDTDFSMYKSLGPLQAGKNARFIVALENAWPKILAALAVPSAHRGGEA